jgi:hypothetical protein
MEPDGSRPFRDLINTYIDATEDDSLTWSQQDAILDEAETLIRQKVETNPDLLDAAPDMLGALVEMVDMFERHLDGRTGPDDAAQRWDNARAAIAKAKGETP